MGAPEVTVPPQELRADFEAVFERLARQGDLVWVRSGQQRLLLVNGAERAREVLIDRAAELVKPRSQTIDLGPPEPEQADERIPAPLFRRALAKGLGAARDPEVAAAAVAAAAVETASWRDGARVRAMPTLRRIGIRVACEAMLGSRLDERGVRRAADALARLDERPRVRVPGEREGGRLRQARAAARLDAAAAALIDGADLSRPSELTAVLNDLPALAPGLRERELRQLVGELLLGAAGPLAQTAGWLLVRLAGEPGAEDVRAEWKEVLGAGPVDAALLPRLRRTEAFVREVTRLHPTNPRITRAAASDTTVGGEEVPARTRVVLNVNAINRDPRGYDEPGRFRPERWLDGHPAAHKLGYLSFGAGPRRCLGEGAGLTALTALLPALCRPWRLAFDELRVTETGRRQLADDTLVTLRAAPLLLS
ncbi:MAG TPA: cytochrome P450 [Gaiellaceae bacterium]|nr:cytochrome P450 [Gaiellaceae bacterium]